MSEVLFGKHVFSVLQYAGMVLVVTQDLAKV